MKKFKKILITFIGFSLLIANSVVPANAVATFSQPVDATGVYEITFMLSGDPTPYVHDANLSQLGSAVSGDGGFPSSGPPHTFHWVITSGTMLGNTINLTMDYDVGAVGTTMNMTGKVLSDGTMSGTWTDNFGGSRNGTWFTSLGTADVLIPSECDEITFTQNPIVGTAGSDNINGTGGDDLIFALGGSDVVDGKGGDDCIVGGNGSDSLKGRSGNDVILGGDGSDAIRGDGGNDDLYGEAGSDAIQGGAGDDDLFGGDNSDSLNGNVGTDSADGGNGSDSCNAETETTCEA